MEIPVIKKDGVVDLSAVEMHYEQLRDGEYKNIVKRVRDVRSKDQNDWLWGHIYPMLLSGLINEGFEFTDTVQVHRFFKSQMLVDRVINKHTGEIIEFPSSTTVMDTTTFSTYTDKLRDYASEYLSLEIPNPDKEWRCTQNR